MGFLRSQAHTDLVHLPVFTPQPPSECSQQFSCAAKTGMLQPAVALGP